MDYLLGSLFWVAFYMFILWPRMEYILWDGAINALELHIESRGK